MYPVLFRIGSFEITSFGVLVAVGALAGIWIFQRELKRASLPDSGVDAAIAGVLGGLLGAKLLWTIEHAGGPEPLADLLFSRGGMSWFGGLIGGVGAGVWWLHRRAVPVMAGVVRFGIEFIRVNESVAGPFTLAQLISAGVTLAGVGLLVKKTRRSG